MSAYRGWQCTWTQALDGRWRTECGESFALHTTAADEHIAYCWHCGGNLVGMDRTRVPHVRPSHRPARPVADLFEETELR